MLIARDGKVTHVILGDQRQITIPQLEKYRVGPQRLKGLRLVHTHLRGEPLSQDDLADLALLRLDLIAALTLTGEGLPAEASIAHLQPSGVEEAPYAVWPSANFHRVDLDFDAFIEELEASLRAAFDAVAVGRQEGAVLLGIFPPTVDSDDAMEELARDVLPAGFGYHPEIPLGRK